MSSNVRVAPREILDQISVLVDPDDARQLDLFTQIQLDPESRSSRDGLITLLFLLLQQKSRGPQSNGAVSARLNELVSYLQSHVALLVAIVHDPQLASLFLVGQQGSQSFTSLQQSCLLEQAARTRKFIGSLPPHSSVQTSLLDYQTLYEKVGALPEKIEELTNLKARVAADADLLELKSAFDEICAILETVLLFNDLLIRQKGDRGNLRREIRALRKENQQLRMQHESVDETLSALTAQVNSAESALDELGCDLKSRGPIAGIDRPQASAGRDASFEELKGRLKRIEKQYRIVRTAIDELPRDAPDLDRISDLETDLRTLKQENALLKEQARQLQAQIENYQTADSQKEQQIERLLQKSQDLKSQNSDAARIQNRQHRTISELQILYKDTSEQVENLTEIKAALSKQLRASMRENGALKNETDELKLLLERANSEAKRQMDDNSVLLRQLRRAGSDDSQERLAEIAALKSRLRAALKLIQKLEGEIADFRARQDPPIPSRASVRTSEDEAPPKAAPTGRQRRSVDEEVARGTRTFRSTKTVVTQDTDDDIPRAKGPGLQELDDAIERFDEAYRQFGKGSDLSVSSE